MDTRARRPTPLGLLVQDSREVGLLRSRVLVLVVLRHVDPFLVLLGKNVEVFEVVLALDTPRPWAALVAALVAWRSGNVFATIGAGMAALHLLKLLF